MDLDDLDSVLVHKHAKKELGQYLAVLTSHFVSNPYVKSEAGLLAWTIATGQKTLSTVLYLGYNLIVIAIWHAAKLR